jgi:hypothetical protein
MKTIVTVMWNFMGDANSAFKYYLNDILRLKGPFFV